MHSDTADDVGKLILRLTLALLLLLHGFGKLMNGVSEIEGMLTGVGLPPFMAYGVLVGEVLAPLLVLLGFYARTGALLIVINMVFALVLAHSDDLFVLTTRGGWQLELQGFFLFTAVALAFMGPGRLSINGR